MRPLVVVDPPGELLRPGQAAYLLEVAPKTLWRWERAGKIRSLRTLGGHRRYRRAEIERFRRERT